MTDTITSDGWTATLVAAGTIPLPGTALGPAGSMPAQVTVPSNVLLLRGHGQVILVDTSAGSLAEEWEGATDDLEGALAAHDCRLADIDMVVLTHLDFDHCGGVATGSYPDGLAPAFPRAQVVASTDAIAWARELPPPDDVTWRCLAVAEDAGRLVEAAYGRELAPGVTLVRTPGHRAGHAAVTVGDAVHPGRRDPPSQPRRPTRSGIVSSTPTPRSPCARGGGARASSRTPRGLRRSHIAGWGSDPARAATASRWRPRC